jgi:hypothetical protein
MVDLSFTDFNDYEHKFETYLVQKNIVDEFKTTKLEGMKCMVKKLNMKNSHDVNQLAFLMWMLIEDFVVLLNNGFLLEVIDLDYFSDVILKDVPELKITSFHGLTPLGGWGATSNDSLSYYDCIKFIGQYTNQQSIYDKCLKSLEALPTKLDGPIKKPSTIMYLMNYNPNKNICTNNNKFKTKPIGEHIDKLYDFRNSVYSPDPSHEKQYNRYKCDLQYAFKELGSTNELAYLCLMNHMVHSHYHVIKNTESITTFYSRIKDERVENIVKHLLIGINNIVFEKVEEKEDFETILKNKIDAKLCFLDKTDYIEMWSIAISAFVYVSDDTYNENENILKRNMLTELYERGIAEPNSKFSHNLMREAADEGRLWLVKFLISKGVRTKDLPSYGAWPWNLESKQLTSILLELEKDYSNYGQEYINNKTKARKRVYNFLLENNYI